MVESGQNRACINITQDKAYWEHPGGCLLILYRLGFMHTCISGMSLKVTQDRATGSDMTLYHLISLKHAGMNQACGLCIHGYLHKSDFTFVIRAAAETIIQSLLNHSKSTKGLVCQVRMRYGQPVLGLTL